MFSFSLPRSKKVRKLSPPASPASFYSPGPATQHTKQQIPPVPPIDISPSVAFPHATRFPWSPSREGGATVQHATSTSSKSSALSGGGSPEIQLDLTFSSGPLFEDLSMFGRRGSTRPPTPNARAGLPPIKIPDVPSASATPLPAPGPASPHAPTARTSRSSSFSSSGSSFYSDSAFSYIYPSDPDWGATSPTRPRSASSHRLTRQDSATLPFDPDPQERRRRGSLRHSRRTSRKSLSRPTSIAAMLSPTEPMPEGAAARASAGNGTPAPLERARSRSRRRKSAHRTPPATATTPASPLPAPPPLLSPIAQTQSPRRVSPITEASGSRSPAKRKRREEEEEEAERHAQQDQEEQAAAQDPGDDEILDIGDVLHDSLGNGGGTYPAGFDSSPPAPARVPPPRNVSLQPQPHPTRPLPPSPPSEDVRPLPVPRSPSPSPPHASPDTPGSERPGASLSPRSQLVRAGPSTPNMRATPSPGTPSSRPTPSPGSRPTLSPGTPNMRHTPSPGMPSPRPTPSPTLTPTRAPGPQPRSAPGSARSGVGQSQSPQAHEAQSPQAHGAQSPPAAQSPATAGVSPRSAPGPQMHTLLQQQQREETHVLQQQRHPQISQPQTQTQPQPQYPQHSQPQTQHSQPQPQYPQLQLQHSQPQTQPPQPQPQSQPQYSKPQTQHSQPQTQAQQPIPRPQPHPQPHPQSQHKPPQPQIQHQPHASPAGSTSSAWEPDSASASSGSVNFAHPPRPAWGRVGQTSDDTHELRRSVTAPTPHNNTTVVVAPSIAAPAPAWEARRNHSAGDVQTPGSDVSLRPGSDASLRPGSDMSLRPGSGIPFSLLPVHGPGVRRVSAIERGTSPAPHNRLSALSRGGGGGATLPIGAMPAFDRLQQRHRAGSEASLSPARNPRASQFPETPNEFSPLFSPTSTAPAPAHAVVTVSRNTMPKAPLIDPAPPPRSRRPRPPLPIGPRKPSVRSAAPPSGLSQTPTTPQFATHPVRWKGLTMDAAKWTFTSSQLQDIVGRAIRQSAEASSIRLLTLDVLDQELPGETQRLQALREDIKSRYGAAVRRRRVLLRQLAGPGGTGGGAALQELADVMSTCDRLSEELFRVMDELHQLSRLRDVHSASALAMALRKLNSSFVKQSAEAAELRAQRAQLEAERDEAWATAERVERELLEMQSAGASNRSSRVSAARKTSVRASKASLRFSRGALRSSHSSSTSSHRLSSVIAPPVPPVPRLPSQQTLSLNTDLPSAGIGTPYSMGLSSALGHSPSSETRELVQVQNELYTMLGLTRADLRRARSARLHVRPASEVMATPSSLPTSPFPPGAPGARPPSDVASPQVLLARRRRNASFSYPRPADSMYYDLAEEPRG